MASNIEHLPKHVEDQARQVAEHWGRTIQGVAHIILTREMLHEIVTDFVERVDFMYGRLLEDMKREHLVELAMARSQGREDTMEAFRKAILEESQLTVDLKVQWDADIKVKKGDYVETRMSKEDIYKLVRQVVEFDGYTMPIFERIKQELDKPNTITLP